MYVILAVAGGCRLDEMNKMQVNDIDDRGSVLVVEVPDTKTQETRKFAVIEERCDASSIKTIQKYRRLRPTHTDRLSSKVLERIYWN